MGKGMGGQVDRGHPQTCGDVVLRPDTTSADISAAPTYQPPPAPTPTRLTELPFNSPT